MNHYEKLFEEYLDLTEFALEKDDKGYWLNDRQGADLGNISDDRFETAAEIVDRMDIYHTDYILTDIDECIDEKGCRDEADREEETFIKIYKRNHNGDCPPEFEIYLHLAKMFLENDNPFEIEILDLFLNHIEEVNLDNVYKGE